jgi:hypothetical protein
MPSLEADLANAHELGRLLDDLEKQVAAITEALKRAQAEVGDKVLAERERCAKLAESKPIRPLGLSPEMVLGLNICEGHGRNIAAKIREGK